jgi:hypothetical protein
MVYVENFTTPKIGLVRPDLQADVSTKDQPGLRMVSAL